MRMRTCRNTREENGLLINGQFPWLLNLWFPSIPGLEGTVEYQTQHRHSRREEGLLVNHTRKRLSTLETPNLRLKTRLMIFSCPRIPHPLSHPHQRPRCGLCCLCTLSQTIYQPLSGGQPARLGSSVISSDIIVKTWPGTISLSRLMSPGAESPLERSACACAQECQQL